MEIIMVTDLKKIMRKTLEHLEQLRKEAERKGFARGVIRCVYPDGYADVIIEIDERAKETRIYTIENFEGEENG